jgi:NAD(P)-dependent dehydrogenase (short-subunit alcohol dehydrogenase family)
MLFQGDPILVTGASTGIGQATARLLAERGARVFLVARRPDLLDAAVAGIVDAGGIAAGVAADISDRDAMLGAIDAAEAAFGPLYGLYANAGSGGQFAALGDYGDDIFEQVLRTNLYSPFWAIKRLLPGMIERKRGAILVTGSLASERGMPTNVGYVASKHGLLGLARAAASEGAAHNVRVNCVVPGLIQTPMMDALPPNPARAARVPQQRMGSSDEMAEVAAFLLSEAASHVTGQSWAVDGGVLGTLNLQS